VSISSSSPPSDGEESDETRSDDEIFVTPVRETTRSAHHLASLRNFGGAVVERAQAKTLKEENKKGKNRSVERNRA
jgi:hypothetical protein